MATGSQQDGLVGWYSNPDASSSSKEILDTMFAHAKVLLRSIVKPEDYDQLFPPTNPAIVSPHSIWEVQQCLQEAQSSYESRTNFQSNDFKIIAPTTIHRSTDVELDLFAKSRFKARSWFTGLSEKIVHYGNIFDVLAQHHPEYVSLAWGTFKLLFVAISNHAETASKLSKSITQIADLLPQQSLLLILYPTSQMQLSVARLYAHILNFFLSSLKWYKNSRAVHAIKSILQPWDLRFRSDYEAIAAEAEQIRQLADVAMKAELRHTREEVGQGTKYMELMRDELSQLRQENQRLQMMIQTRFESMEGAMTYMYQELRVDFSAQRATLNRVHLNQMLSLPLWSSLPTSGESLQFCRAMRDRRRDRANLPLPDVARLESWVADDSKAMLLIDTFVQMTAKAFMLDFIDLVIANDSPIVWALRYADYWDRNIGLADILRMLTLQLMQVQGERLLDGAFPVTVEQLRDAASLQDWITIMKRILSGNAHAFIVLDADLIDHATANDRGTAREILDLLKNELAGKVKIVIAMSAVGNAYAEELEHESACIRMQLGGTTQRRLHRPRRIQERVKGRMIGASRWQA